MKILKIVLIPILSLIQYVSIAQYNGILSHNQTPAAIEKVYLQTDRDFYFVGDTIWFKAYLLDGRSLSPVSDIQNLYIDLIDSTGRISCNHVLFCENGHAAGNITISDTTSTGPFVLRAYTDYLKNFGEEMFFHKILRISEVKNFYEIASGKPVIEEEKPEIDVSFLPEGGYMLEGIQNVIAFKAVDRTGKGVSISGMVLDSKGHAESIFRTDYKGMGKLFFTPIKGESYEVRIEGYPDFEYHFMDIRNEAEKLVLMKQSKEELTLGVITNSSRRSREHFSIACLSRDSLLFFKEFVLRSNKTVRIETDVMLGGINRFVLLNEDLEPVSERLVFSDNFNANYLEVKPSHEEYVTRSLVQLDITDEIGTLASDCSNLSVAAVDENTLYVGGENQNIVSYLLLNSELKGFVESPADFFIDDHAIKSQEKLNLLMLTQGWSRYLRNTFKENEGNFNYHKTAGITIHGKAEKITGHRSIVNGNVTLGIFEDSIINSYESKTDSLGRFSFDNLVFFDTATIFAQVLNERGKQKSEIFIDTVRKSPVVTPEILNLMRGFRDIPLQLYRQEYDSYMEYRKLHPDEVSVLLEEVEIRGKKPEPDDGHFRLYRRADQVLEITDHGYGGDVLQYLQGRVAGLIVGPDYVTLRGFTSLTRDPTPLFLLDSSPLSGDELTLSLIRSIPMSEIDKVEILKGNSAAIYGSRAANGVIAIYTKKGVVSDEIVYSKLVGAITQRVAGFSSNREFYSPKYTPDNIDSPEPDRRTTLYWDPDITTENGKASISFFTADDLAYYRIIVEGITDSGCICIGSARFAVTGRNESSHK